MSEITLTLNNPLTDEQWDKITDVDFDHTDRIMFHTKHGKDVEFVKSRAGRWIEDSGNIACSECHIIWLHRRTAFCPNCGARMEVDDAGDL